jgi:hypothetical protein
LLKQIEDGLLAVQFWNRQCRTLLYSVPETNCNQKPAYAKRPHIGF